MSRTLSAIRWIKSSGGLISGELLSSGLISSELFCSRLISSELLSSGLLFGEFISGRLLSGGLLSGGLLSDGLMFGGLLSGGMLTGGLLSGGLLSGGLSGGMLTGGLLSGGLMSGGLMSGGLLFGGLMFGEHRSVSLWANYFSQWCGHLLLPLCLLSGSVHFAPATDTGPDGLDTVTHLEVMLLHLPNCSFKVNDSLSVIDTSHSVRSWAHSTCSTNLSWYFIIMIVIVIIIMMETVAINMVGSFMEIGRDNMMLFHMDNPTNNSRSGRYGRPIIRTYAYRPWFFTVMWELYGCMPSDWMTAQNDHGH